MIKDTAFVRVGAIISGLISLSGLINKSYSKVKTHTLFSNMFYNHYFFLEPHMCY